MKKDETKVSIQRAKGRPMLTWVGKKPLTTVTSFPAQLVESYSPEIPSNFSQKKENWEKWPLKFTKGGLLFHGDNKDVLAYLLANGFRGKVDLVYIDPPFDSGADYIRKVHLRGTNIAEELNGEHYSLGEQIQYTDIWGNDNYLQFIYERLILLRELLSDNGSIYLHLDYRRNSSVRCIMDEVFGQEKIKNEIIWHYADKFATGGKALDKNHDTIYHYSKSENFIGNEIRIPKDNKTKRPLRQKVNGKTINVLNEKGEKIIAEYSDKVIDDVWEIGRTISKNEDTNYPTQKKEMLIERIIKYGSNQGDLILDCFLGSGTTSIVAQNLGRRWIGCDINKGAIQTTTKRLQVVIEEQIKDINKSKKTLPGMNSGEKNLPAQLVFNVYRVNDYDLQIQHNEAVNLACEHIGISRSQTDSFFDGTLGKKLARIIPFNHPLTPIDLEEVKRELDSRKGEDRDIVLVCLGKELAASAWLEEWNKLRSKTSVPNKIEVIELRTDEKYGGFMMHEPVQADVETKRTGDEIKVKINNFISPAIIKRLKNQSGVLTPQIDDWRSMVDSVMIDTNYDNKVFNIVIADVPGKKDDLVTGEYIFPANKGPQTIAVKITDMLGEELLITRSV